MVNGSQQHHVLDTVPNFTTKSTGMGLGLAMVKNIIENANGSIWFETKEEIGTSFFIRFPKA